MAEAIGFDAHRFVKNLTANGFSGQQAEALATEQVSLLNSSLATRMDIAELRRSTETRIEAPRAELLKWMFGAVAVQTGILVAVTRLL